MSVFALSRASLGGRSKRTVAVIVVLAGLFGIAYWFYWPIRNSAFGLDDPSLVYFYETTDLSWSEKTVLYRGANRWRPMANLGYWAMEGIFGSNYTGWWSVLVCLVGFLAAAFFYFALKITKSLLAASLLALLVVTSHFSQYQATQATGLMEGLGNLAVLATLGLVCLHFVDSRRLFIWLSIVTFVLAILIHERYLFICAPLGLYFLVARGVTTKKRLGALIALATVVCAYLFVKIVHFGLPFAVGTGSSHSLGFTRETAFRHASQGLWSVFGINLGEPYLAGLTFPNQSPAQQFAAFVSFVALIVLLTGRRNRDGVDASWSLIGRSVLFGSTALLWVLTLLVPVVVTIRLEQRWLVASHLALVFFIALRLRRANVEQEEIGYRRTNPILVAAVVASVFLNYQYRQNIDGIFFRGAQVGAEVAVRSIVPFWKEAIRVDGSIYLLTTTPDPAVDSSLNTLIVANTDLPERRVFSATDVGGFVFPMNNPVIASVSPENGEWSVWTPPEGVDIVRGGEWYEDGWVGRQLFGTVVSPVCERVTVTVWPSPFGANSLGIETSWGAVLDVDIGNEVVVQEIEVPSPEIVRLTLTFASTWNASSLGVGSDVRELSNQISLQCRDT